MDILNIAKNARDASLKLAIVDTKTKNSALLEIAKAIEKNRAGIKKENLKDIKEGEKKRLSKAFIDRLTLTDKQIDEMISGLKVIAGLDDPVGRILDEWTQKDGLKIKKVSVPIGTILMIYESRPNVTIDAAALCLKSGNSVILRGGSDSVHSNTVLAKIFSAACKKNSIPNNAVQLVAGREAVKELLKQDRYIDLVIPRGGYGLVKMICENSMIPVLKHLDGVCNMYVDKEADLDMALRLCINAKCQRPGVCNAIENLIVHKEIAEKFLPKAIEKLKENGVKVLGDNKVQKIADVEAAKEEDWSTEYLDLILSIKVADDIDDAISFINRYGSKHSDAIVSENDKSVAKFMQSIDASAVFVNASTRFNDGFQFGFGAEIGISTDKIHARGPVALKELNTYKYLVYGNGQLRK